ncbi:hypothetical protein [Microbispora sp. ATCC PTA-5024]|nr:hypothetical protein [Microbispora sp. ATCC PTA-5024]ETK31914.1 hypothetical protein MPTA5024_32420 [Microbispora sp. ATCC PTA-5024]
MTKGSIAYDDHAGRDCTDSVRGYAYSGSGQATCAGTYGAGGDG